jgi:AcrR family transcriptional regulator
VGVARLQEQDRRSRIIGAARAAFGQYGYRSTTTGAIARRAGVSEATIFREFGPKEALFEAAVLTPFTEFMRAPLAHRARNEPPDAQHDRSVGDEAWHVQSC